MRLRTAVAVDVRSPIPIALLDRAILTSLGLKTGTRTILRHRSRKLAVWVRDAAEFATAQTVPEGLAAHDVIWLSKRARDLLLVPRSGADVILDARPHRELRVKPALVDDLPHANEVHVGREVIADLGTDRAIAYSKCGSIPIRLREREMGGDAIRMTMLMRSLMDVDRGEMIEIGPLQRERLFFADRGVAQTVAGKYARRVVATARWAGRLVFFGWESLLRLWLHAPVLAMRTVEAEIGDDTNRIVRMAPETLRVLGVQPGDEVILEWLGTRVVAVAHEKIRDAPAGVHRGVTADDWGSDPQADAIPLHLVIGVAAEMRGEMRIPRRTIVSVRRRVASLFAKRLNDLTVPIGGLLFAALAMDKISVSAAAIGAVIVTVLAMAPARHRVAPRGRWP